MENRLFSLILLLLVGCHFGADMTQADDDGSESGTETGLDDLTPADDGGESSTGMAPGEESGFDAESGSSDSSDASSSEGSESTGEPVEPIKPDLWYRFDGDLTNDGTIEGADGEPLGVMDFQDGVLLLDEGASVDASAFGSHFRDALDGLTVVVQINPSRWDEPFDYLFSLGSNGEGLDTNVFGVIFQGTEIVVVTETGDGEDFFASVEASPGLGAWHKLVFVFDNSMIKLFENGYYMGSTVYTPTETNSTNLKIGAGPLNTYHFNGSMNDFRIYLQPLSDEDALILSE